MAEDATYSWLRRTNFSHTIYHRVDSSRMPLYSFDHQQDRISGLKSRPGAASGTNVRPNHPVRKLRSLSPLTPTAISDTFREARSNSKRFLTPGPRRNEQENRNSGKITHRDSEAIRKSNPRSSSPFKHFTSLKIYDKMKSKKESTWSRYFDHGGGRVTAVETSDEFIVDLSKLFLGQRFAHGANSRLYHGIYKEEPVAVKIITVPDDDDNEALAVRLENQYSREVTLLSRLHNSNVIKFVAACKKPPVFCVITEYLPEGSLRSYLHKLEQRSLPLEKVISISLDICHGMEFIHSQGVIHRDLKPENILIDQNFHMKIADFGIACEEAYCDSLAEDPGTYRWMAPEMIKHKSYSKKVDVYSFGLILWELVSGRIPYEDMTPIQAAFAVVNKGLRPTVPRDCPPAMKALIEQCWSLHPEKRPEFWQVVKVLEQFGSSLARDGCLSLVENPTCQDQRKGLLHWIQKLGPVHPNTSTTPKPKFT